MRGFRIVQKRRLDTGHVGREAEEKTKKSWEQVASILALSASPQGEGCGDKAISILVQKVVVVG